MVDSAAKLAQTVLKQNFHVKKGESVLIESWTHSLPYARAFVDEARRLGARATLLYEDEGSYWDAVSAKHYGPFQHLSEAEKAAVSNADVYVYFWGPEDTPRREKLPDAVQEKLMGYNEEWYAAARRGGLRGCRMSLGQSTDPAAQHFGLDGSNWRERLVEAGTVDAKRMLLRGNRVAKRLRDGKELRVEHPNGTDLRIALQGVHTRVDTGIPDAAQMKRPYGMMGNNPSGQVFIAVDRSNASGTFVSNRAVYLGLNKFDGSRWTFQGGKLVERQTGAGAERLEKAYASAPKGKDQLGYFSIGLNPASRDLPPVEDTEEGAILIGVGSNAMAGGKIRIPFQAYALLGEATISVDGTPLARGGRLA